MSLVHALLVATSLFFALNMGGSGLAPAFAGSLGAKLLRRPAAVFLFTVFVLVGALGFGGFVAKTLGRDLVPTQTLNEHVVLCVLLSASGALFLANLLKIPQSTSWVTVFAIVAVGLHFANLKPDTILYRLLPAWIGLPLTSFLLTAAVTRFLYPLRTGNMRAHERIVKHGRTMNALALSASCYVALAIGSNNVANVVGPLSAAGVIDVVDGFVLVAPLFGLGAFLFRAPAETVGNAIVPLGLATATITNVITGSLLIFASWQGIPQSLVQINAASIIAVSLVKEGSWSLMPGSVLQKIGVLWIASPLIAAMLTAILLRIVE
jgi:sulfate permease